MLATTHAHYPVGWALAMNTPYQWTKQVASHFGGTRNGTIVHWPNAIDARGEMRWQFHHVIDVAPTILEAAGLPEPLFVNGVPLVLMEFKEPGVALKSAYDDNLTDYRDTIPQLFIPNCLVLLSNAANLLIFVAAGVTIGRPALVPDGLKVPEGLVADPLAQAFILTAIVIGFGVLAFAVVLIRRAHEVLDVDDFDELKDAEQ